MKIIKPSIILFFLCSFTILATGCIKKQQQSQEYKNEVKETVNIEEKNISNEEEKKQKKLIL